MCHAWDLDHWLQGQRHTIWGLQEVKGLTYFSEQMMSGGEINIFTKMVDIQVR